MPVALPDLPQTQAAIIEMTNAFRAENRLGAVTLSPRLEAAAKSFADFLARSGSFAHTADGRQPAERATAAGYQYCIVAENLALHKSNRGFETTDLAQRIVEGWKNSPPHRANLLQPHVTEAGIAIARSGDKDPKFLTVQLFGRPSSFKYSISIENISGAAVPYMIDDQKNTIVDSMYVTHTTCVPHELTFDIGRVTSKYQARDGEVFIIARSPDGKVHIDVEQPKPAVAAMPAPAPASASLASAKSSKAR